MTDLTVVVVTHNSARDLPTCLGSLFEHQRGLALSVVISDSGSTDETAAAAARFPVVFLPGENRGFAAANNRALARPGMLDTRYLLFLNPDTAILEGTLEDLIAACDDRPRSGVFSVRHLNEEGRLLPSLFRFPSPARYLVEALRVAALRDRFGHDLMPGPEYRRERSFDWASGAFLLVRAEVLRQVGWFDERFFFTSEEVDLCRRAKAAGWEATYLPAFAIMHRREPQSMDAWRAWILTHHKLVYADKWCSPPGRLLVRVGLLLRHGVSAVSPWRSAAQRRGARIRVRAVLGLPASSRGDAASAPPPPA